MASAKNRAIAGDYAEWFVNYISGKVTIDEPRWGKKQRIPVTKDTVESYEVIEEESNVSAASAVGRGAIGALLLGPVGLAAALSAKKKGIYTIGITFKDGKRSMLEVDKDKYKAITTILF